jgi:TolB-like protein
MKRGLFAELKRRNVLRAALLYLGAVWALAQGVAQLGPSVGAPDSTTRWFLIASGVGFPFWIAFAWFFEFTQEGLKLERDVAPEESITPRTGRKFDFAIIAVLAVAVVLLLTERFTTWGGSAGNLTKSGPEAGHALAGRGYSIAVMAFEDLSPAHDQGYFSDGMAEEILNALGRIKELRVLGRSSSLQDKGKGVDPRRIGIELGVAHILDGSVRRQGDLVRIAATLLSTADGVAQWTKEYNGKLADLFDLQDNCARDIAAELKIVLTGGQRPLVDKVTANPEAYALYVEAQTLVRMRFGDSLPRAIEKIDAALKLDASFARAWSKRAVAYAVLTQYVGGNWQANWDESEKSASRALALDPNDAEAYAARSYNLFSQRHYVDMIEPMRRALQLDPESETARYWHINELTSMGHTHEVTPLLDALAANDPENPRVLFYEAFMSWRRGDRAAMLAFGKRLQMLGSPWGDLAMASYDSIVGNCDDGAKLFPVRLRMFGSKITTADSEALYRGMCAGGAAGETAKAILAAHPEDAWAPTLWMELGEPQRSFTLFEEGGTGLSDGYLNWLWQPDAWSLKARQSPAFQGFATRIGLVDYWKKYGWPDQCRQLSERGANAFVCQ